MAFTNVASVAIERLIVHDAAATEPAGKLGGEPGDTSEWLLRIEVNGQVIWWQHSGIANIHEYSLNKNFPSVPLIDGNLTMKITGYEQDTFGDTKLNGYKLTVRPGDEFPYGASGLWVNGGAHGGYDAEYLGGKEGAYGWRFSVQPIVRDNVEEARRYVAVVREGSAYAGYWVSDWNGFTSNHDVWKSEGLYLARVAASEADPARASFSPDVSRTFLGVYGSGTGNSPFWLLEREAFRLKVDEHAREGLQLIDVFSYWEDGHAMLGGTFGSGATTDLVVAPRFEFERDWAERRRSRHRLIALDTYHDGRERFLVGVYERSGGDNVLRVAESLDTFKARKAELDAAGFRLVDICTFNEGHELRLCGIWHQEGPPSHLITAASWEQLVARLDAVVARKWHIAALDTWSPAERA